MKRRTGKFVRKAGLSAVLRVLAPGILAAALACSCAILYTGRSWPLDNSSDLPSLSLTRVEADKTGGSVQTEKEIADLAPLLFYEHGFKMFDGNGKADYEAEIQVREREYISGWRTKRSLSAEVRIRSGSSPGRLLAAGLVTAEGDESFSSSRTLRRMLSIAVRKAAAALEKQREKS
jgi:hypothetical protein